MIRKRKDRDIDRLMEIWLSSNLQAHDFIAGDYWKNHFDEVKKALLKADIFVFQKDGRIVGFAGMDGNYLAGIFVDQNYRNRGIGKQLLNYVKQNYDEFSLDVYHKNKRAIHFYLKNGFRIVEDGIDSDTNEKEYRMVWKNRG